MQSSGFGAFGGKARRSLGERHRGWPIRPDGRMFLFHLSPACEFVSTRGNGS